MTIDKNKVVSVKYSLFSPGSLSAEEQFIEKADDANPLVWIFGIGAMIPDFEKNLEGKAKGATFDFRIKAADAYGEFDPTYIITIPIESFKDKDGNIDRTMLAVGKTLPMMDNHGNHLNGVVKEVTLSEVKMDFNHPMAGRDLHFIGEVLEVRAATSEELDHGHVHGEHGHHH